MEKAKFDLESFPTSNSARKMLGYVSDGFYDKSYVGKWMYQVMGLEYDKALEIVKDMPLQFFPETATWGLMYHEIKWGLPVRENLSYEERRRLIYQKRDYRASMTPYRMEKILQDATGFEVHVADIHDSGKYGFFPRHPNVFMAYFLGEGTPDAKIVFETLNRLKQSHTSFIVNYRMEIVLDNRNLERFILRNIRFKTVLQNIHGLALGLIIIQKIHNYEAVDNATVITKRNPFFYDGSVKYNDSKIYNAIYREEAIQ